MSRTREELNDILGVPSTPSQVAGRMIDLCRGTGRTTQLIESLPADGKAVIVVWNNRDREHILGVIRRNDPDYPYDRLKFVTFFQWEHRDPRISGIDSMPAFVDNNVLDMMAIRLVEDVDAFFDRKKSTALTYQHLIDRQLNEVVEELLKVCFRRGITLSVIDPRERPVAHAKGDRFSRLVVRVGFDGKVLEVYLS